jgi:hypothetical protein
MAAACGADDVSPPASGTGGASASSSSGPGPGGPGAGGGGASPPLGIEWITSFGGGGEPFVTAIASLADGGVVVLGSFQGSINALDGTRIDAAVGQDGFVLWLSAQGEPTRLATLASDTDVFPYDITVTDEGEVVAVGAFTSDLDVTGEILPFSGDSPEDGFYVRYAANGTVLNVHQFGQPGSEGLPQVAPSTAGGVLLAGTYSDDLEILGEVLVPPEPSGSYVYLLRVDGGDAIDWSTSVGPNVACADLHVAPDGSMGLAAMLYGDLVVGRERIQPTGILNVLWLAMDDSGDVVQAASASSDTDPFFAFPLVERTSDGMLISAALAGTFSLEGGTRFTTPSPNVDILLAHVDAGGPVTFAQQYGDRYGSYILSLMAQDSARVAAGFFAGVLDLGAGPMVSVMADGFVAGFDANGVATWSRSLARLPIVDAVLLANQRILVAGSSEGATEIDGHTLSPTGIFVARMAPPE